ncbi:DUF3710 domain-containing protein [Prescottella agglutinans]|uniref:DUF3710 domain-containing protein n=1 Tax=Prescottella agglutinans TaxID=1644129 RepID=A0A3S3EAR3_9NOCA|nr:DUF3710 domain-containing protein [Prescottella agglutinans]RVW09648.1 DUF3710 domain-containing protein [Prescottella agglutinans]
MFGRRKNKDAAAADDAAHVDIEYGTDEDFYEEDFYEDYEFDGSVGAVDAGPFDSTDLAEGEEPAATRLDLGSVLLPMPDGAQLQVEMSPEGTPQAVHLVTQFGRVTVSAYAAPKSPGQWREVASELAESLRGDNAEVSIESGPWGREVIGVTPNADLRFIGVDGPRWMIRCVVAGPSGNVAAGSPLVEIARDVLRDTVVNRGSDPHPVRTPLPVVLPQVLVEQLVAVQQQQLAAQQQAVQEQLAAQQQAQQQATQPQVQQQPAQPRAQQQPAQPQAPQQPGPEGQPGNGSEPPRRGESGSAMQQLGL